VGSRPAKRAILTYRGRLAQLVRASVLHTEGQRFKPSTAHFSFNFSPEWLVIDGTLIVLLTQLAADFTLFIVSSEV
jgi:hypothetical protein